MPQKTPQELQEAKRQRAKERRDVEQEAMERMDKDHDLYARHGALSSYVDGIYDEVSKLSAKRPTDIVSARMVERANRAIKDARELLAVEGDPFLDEIQLFIEAGDPTEARDVVLTLRQVKDALARLKHRHFLTWNNYSFS